MSTVAVNNACAKKNKSEEAHKQLSSFKTDLIDSTSKIVHEYLPIKVVSLSELFEEFNTKQTEIERIKYELQNKSKNEKNENSKEGIKENHKTSNKTTNNKSNKNNSNNKRKRSFNQMAFDDKDKNEENKNRNDTDIHVLHNKYCAKNEEIERFTDLIKKEVKELIDYLDQIALFISLHIPKIEDGNNFGVQIQEQMKGMISGGQMSAQDFLRNIPKFHTLRAKLITKIQKYPNMQDYQKSVIELDFKQMLMLKHCLRDLRNNYWILYDVLTKNWDKIIKPKGEKNTTFSMY